MAEQAPPRLPSQSPTSCSAVVPCATRDTQLHVESDGDEFVVELPPADEVVAGVHDSDVQQAEEDDEPEDDGHSDLQKAARAGIRLLEENAQLTEEVRYLQQQVVHAQHHTRELHRTLRERDERVEQLSHHLREAICENQSVLAELSRVKEQLAGVQTLVVQMQAKEQRSPRRRSLCSVSSLPAPFYLPVDVQTVSTFAVVGTLTSADHTIGRDETTASTAARAGGTSAPDSKATTPLSSPFSGPGSPRQRRHAARLEEMEDKFEEAHRRNSILKRELLTANRKVNELKPLIAQLDEASGEIHRLRGQVERLQKQLQVVLDERSEESALIHSLRATVEIYQTLDDPTWSGKHHRRTSRGSYSSAGASEVRDDEQALRLASMRRRSSDTCVVLPLHSKFRPPVCWTNGSGASSQTLDESEMITESLGSLADQLQQVRRETAQIRPPKSSIDTGDESSDAKDALSLPLAATDSHQELQLAVLHDLLGRYRAQSREASEVRRMMEGEKAGLLKRIEALSLLAQRQCELCARANAELAQESDTWEATASVYESLLRHGMTTDREENNQAEHLCFSALRRFVDSWTADRSKRMRLHDWLTNAIRNTGRRKPLYIPDLSDEIASGFEMLLVPILQTKFGVDVRIEKRLRNVVVTDLKLHIVETDSQKAKACLQRLSRSLMWIVDVEAAQGEEESEWMGSFARKKAARTCLGNFRD